MPSAANANDKKFGYIYKRTKRVEGNPAIVLFGGQVDATGRLSVQIPNVKGYTITKLGLGDREYDWWLSYTKNGATFTFNWQDFRLLLDEVSVTTYENVPADALNASKLVSQVITRSEPWAKFPDFMAQFPVSQWFAANVNNSRYITERVTTRYKYREIFRDDIIVAKGVKLYEIDTIEEFTERVYLRKDQVGGLQPYTSYTPELVPVEYTKTTYKKECLTRWQEIKETSINKGQNTKSSGYLFQQKTEVRDVYSIPEIQYRPPAYPVTQKPLLGKAKTGRAGVSPYVNSCDFQSASTLTTTKEVTDYARWLGETRWQRYYSRELACGYTSTLGYQPFQGVLAGNGLFIRDRFGISLNNEGDSWQFVEDCIGNKIGGIPEIAAPPIAYPPLLISTLNIAAIANQTLTVDIPITPIQLATAGGTAPYTFSSATLPTGLSISGAQIVGIPTAIATTSVTVTVTDSLFDTDSTTFNIAVVAAPVPVAIINETYTLDISVALEVTVSLSIGIPVPFEVDINVDINVTVTMVLMKILTSEIPLGAIAGDSRISRVSLLNSEVPLGAIASDATVQRVIDLTSEVPLGAIGSDGHLNRVKSLTSEVPLGVIGSEAGIGTPVVPLWTPANISTQLWLDAADSATITLASGVVSQWNDKSGNSRHATQTLSNRRPTVLASNINGLDVLSFDNADDGMATGLTMSPLNNYMIFVVANQSSNGYTRIVQSGSINALISQTTPAACVFVGSTVRNTAWATANTTHQSVLVAPSSGNFVFYGNGLNLTTGSVGVRAWGLFGIGSSGTSFEPLTGRLCEIVVVYASDIDTRQKMEGYLAHKWGLTANLPSDHPYKVNPPTV